MANKDAANGFKPVMHLNGSPYNGQSRLYFSTADNLFMGDLVIVAADPVLHTNGGVYREVDRGATGDRIYGVVVGWEVNPTALGNLYHAASSTYGVHIADADDLIFEAQSNDATMVKTDVGLNVDFVVAAGSTATGLSNMEINGSTAAATNTLDLILLEMVARPDNDTSDSVASQRFLVKLNKSGWVDQLVGV